MSANCNVNACTNITAGFIDLASYDEIEKYLYGCGDAVSYFVRTTCKSTWFTQVPVILPLASGTPNFGNTFSVNISRQGDYLLQTWLRVCLPKVQLSSLSEMGGNPNGGIRWTRNLMHNLVKEVCITFNDLMVARFDSVHLDFWASFTVPAEKQVGYSRMIGDFDDLIDLSSGSEACLPPALTNLATPNPADIDTQPEHTVLYLPLPFFYARDTGVALPTAALPYNDMTIDFEFRNWDELLIGELAANNANSEYRRRVSLLELQGEPVLSGVEVWGNYALVSNDERKRMACAPRDILIEQAQWMMPKVYRPRITPSPRLDLRLSHAIKVLFFAVRNTTFAAERSWYAVGSPMMGTPALVPNKFSGQFQSIDPLAYSTLVYENVNRLNRMDALYYSHLNPYYHAPNIPEVTGLHSYSYSLDFICLDPMGSTNYGKLSHVSIIPEPSIVAVAANGQTGSGSLTRLPLQGGSTMPPSPNTSGVNIQQNYEFVLYAINLNIIRISGGALGFPIL